MYSFDVELDAARLDALRDEHDRERVRDGPDEPRDVPPDVALGEVDVALDDAAGSDELGSHRSPQRSHANTSRSSSSSPSASNSRPVAAKNASSSVSASYRRLRVLGRLEGEQLPAVEDADALGEHLGLVEVVRAEQDRRVVRLADLADELLHLELRARVEARRRLVEQKENRRRQQRASERDLLLHPSRQRSPSAPSGGRAGSRRARGSPGSCPASLETSCRRTAPRS